jgi:hypothetical protein
MKSVFALLLTVAALAVTGCGETKKTETTPAPPADTAPADPAATPPAGETKAP